MATVKGSTDLMLRWVCASPSMYHIVSRHLPHPLIYIQSLGAMRHEAPR